MEKVILNKQDWFKKSSEWLEPKLKSFKRQLVKEYIDDSDKGVVPVGADGLLAKYWLDEGKMDDGYYSYLIEYSLDDDLWRMDDPDSRKSVAQLIKDDFESDLDKLVEYYDGEIKQFDGYVNWSDKSIADMVLKAFGGRERLQGIIDEYRGKLK